MQVLVLPSSLSAIRLADGVVGSGVIITYGMLLSQDIANGLVALSRY